MNKKNLPWIIPSVLLMIGSVVIWAHLYHHPASHNVKSLPSIEGVQDGKPLYEFLMKEIPEVVSQIPCACCGHALSWCYEGGCPPT